MPPEADSTFDHIHIGALLFPEMDQFDFTGPFEVLSRLPHSTFHVVAKEHGPIRDGRGLLLLPEETMGQTPPLDVLVVPGGYGQQALMDDEAVLDFIRGQARSARYVFSVCTGALLLGSAGLLRGKRATTHWASLPLLPYFGAIPMRDRVVLDGNLLSAGGVSSGIDGALRLAALLRGTAPAQAIQLYMQYAPEPPFQAGLPETAPREVWEQVRREGQTIAEARLATAQRIAERLGITVAKDD